MDTCDSRNRHKNLDFLLTHLNWVKNYLGIWRDRCLVGEGGQRKLLCISRPFLQLRPLPPSFLPSPPPPPALLLSSAGDGGGGGQKRKALRSAFSFPPLSFFLSLSLSLSSFFHCRPCKHNISSGCSSGKEGGEGDVHSKGGGGALLLLLVRSRPPEKKRERKSGSLFSLQRLSLSAVWEISCREILRPLLLRHTHKKRNWPIIRRAELQRRSKKQ